MNAAATVRAAALARLRADPAVAVNRVWNGADGRGTMPYAVLRDVTATDWGTKDRAGRELRLALTIRDEGESATRAETLAAAAEAALLDLPRDLPGWRIASAAPLRAALVTETPGRWAVLIDVRIRVLAT